MASARSLANKCDACGNEYDSLKRKPKFLKCFHTFCLLCLQSLISDGTTINCPTCNEETNSCGQSIDEDLQTNFYIMTSLPAITETFDDVDLKKKHYYWCLNCNATVEEDTSCLKNHETHDLETEKGREIAENNLKTLYVKCKAQWNGCLAKHRETQSAFKEAQIALQAVEMQIDIRIQESECHITKLQKQLSSVANRLSKPIEEKQTGESIHRLFHEYNQQTIESKLNKTSEFDSIRNAIVSMDIQNSNGGKLTIPLFNSALINFPSEGANEQESHLLTSLSTLILLSTQKEQWATSSLKQNKTSEPKEKPIQAMRFEIPESKIKTTGAKSKTKAFGSESKKEGFGREVQGRKTSKPLTRAVSDVGKWPEHFLYTSKREKFIPSSPRTDSNRNEKQGNVRPIRQEQFTLNESMKWNPSSPTFQESTYYFSQPAMMPPALMSLQNKKICFTLAVNGKHYGNIVIDLRPDLAPMMCYRFVQSCQVTEGPTYHGTIIYKSKPKTFVMGGKVPGPESLYMADLSPLKKTRGAIFFRLKRDYVKTQCSIVSTEFCIHLGEESHENHRTSTVFGYVCDGLAVCDAISYMDCDREHIAIAEAKII